MRYDTPLFLNAGDEICDQNYSTSYTKVVTDIDYSNRDVKKNETDSDELGTLKEQPKDIPNKETSTEIKTAAFQESIDNIIVGIFSSVVAIQSVELLQKVNLPDPSLPIENTKVQNEPQVIIIGMIFFGLGVGMASMITLLYILEASPNKIRGALVNMNGLLITGGQFLLYLINLALADVKEMWVWMLALLDFHQLFNLDSCLSYLSLQDGFTEGKLDESSDISVKIYPAEEVENEMIAMKKSVEEEKEIAGSIGSSTFTQIKKAFGNSTCRRALYASIGVQVAQQFVGINTVMYYSPTIMQFSEFVSNKTVVVLSFITSDLNVVRSIVSMAFIVWK
ncbi:putative inositol transporter 3 [Capsicum baccatum]|uniref:Inositol transporter 3 n=1 Tax=Capsicum baccatum TaxID=33114 RepID=A0A2G2VF14_CAPBA|nr:putative inositol transporter 3 [Capsicum baccatum]